MWSYVVLVRVPQVEVMQRNEYISDNNANIVIKYNYSANII